MKKGSIEDWLDIVPQWLNFALRFPADPRGALQPYAGAGAVSRDLTLLVAAGLGVAYLAILVAAPPSLARYLASTLHVLRGVDLALLPALLLLVLLGAALGVHLLTRAFTALATRGRPGSRWAPYLGGTVEDSVNAFLGVAAVLIPLAVVAARLATSLSRSQSGRLWGIFLLLVLFAYVPPALATVHPKTTFRQAVVAFAAAAGVAALAVVVWR